ncbi:hypothetical protein CAPTEDRAFT_164413 [Capitella teleta]|uniref:Large ribosomal subunit protein mL49 n=1 Tax=Capitella teleta TaxID=283909 RepID=R7UVK2_CAPTE|nr:hypothetical protein CAPTEDRAFT_164413 [Capitella teleta]|eukprot:ELU10648.1 hypothetical protein CAPTEDRAFT_164413 [Capitella teleta]
MAQKTLLTLLRLRLSIGLRNYSSAAFRSHQFIREKKPDADLDVETNLADGEQLVFAPEPTLTEVEVTRDPVEWSAVERLLPQLTVPEPPIHAQYPTPSGWVPQTCKRDTAEYFVGRTRFHNYPIYQETFEGGNRHMTVLNNVEGDIWAFEADLKKFLAEETGSRIYTQVDEVCCKVRVRGIFLEECSRFYKQKGF